MKKFLIIEDVFADEIIQNHDLDEHECSHFQEINAKNVQSLVCSKDDDLILAQASKELDPVEYAREYLSDDQLKELFFEKTLTLSNGDIEQMIDAIDNNGIKIYSTMGLSLRQTMALEAFMENLKNI